MVMPTDDDLRNHLNVAREHIEMALAMIGVGPVVVGIDNSILWSDSTGVLWADSNSVEWVG